jgi:hypothetical protein
LHERRSERIFRSGGVKTLAGAEGESVRGLGDGDGVSPNDVALLITKQEEEMLFQIVQDGGKTLGRKAQILGDEGGRHGLAQARQLADDKVAYLVVRSGHEGMPGVIMPRDLREVLFPFLAWDFYILATLTE